MLKTNHFSINTHTHFGTHLHSAGTHNWNLFKLLVTISKVLVTYTTLQTHIGKLAKTNAV